MVTACAIVTAAEGSVRLAKASGHGGGDYLPARLRAWLRVHRVEAAWLAYRPGRSDHWLKIKNPASPAVQREAEDWR